MPGRRGQDENTEGEANPVKVGYVINVEIEGIGVMKNRVVTSEQAFEDNIREK